MQFVKVHGAGNDFVLLPDLDDKIALTPALVRNLCRPHLGLGGDGVIRLTPGRQADVFMDYWNADGTVAEMCGNGVRCVAKYLVDRGIVDGDEVLVDTRAGVKPVRVAARHPDGRVAQARVAMGAPVPTGEHQIDVSSMTVAEAGVWPDGAGSAPAPGSVAAVTAEQRWAAVLTLSMGNPHAVVVVDDVAAAPVRTWGPVIERDTAFPDGTNVEFIAVPARDHVIGRIWERGVGETLASGTGASAMAAAAHLRDLADRRVTVSLPGGDLAVEWTDDTLYVTGPAVEVGAGELDPAWLADLEDAKQS